MLPYTIPFALVFLMPDRRLLLRGAAVISIALIALLVYNIKGVIGSGDDADVGMALTIFVFGVPCIGLWAGTATRLLLWQRRAAGESAVERATLAVCGFALLPLLFFITILSSR
ncbi:hypothetical protein [Undibacterium sp. TJN19]|uniref:hypothetical protein n=1 Tax=Undibacterium sp. TJN19 TaxID=3413055 RepID=UPI003BF108E1